MSSVFIEHWLQTYHSVCSITVTILAQEAQGTAAESQEIYEHERGKKMTQKLSSDLHTGHEKCMFLYIYMQ